MAAKITSQICSGQCPTSTKVSNSSFCQGGVVGVPCFDASDILPSLSRHDFTMLSHLLFDDLPHTLLKYRGIKPLGVLAHNMDIERKAFGTTEGLTQALYALFGEEHTGNSIHLRIERPAGRVGDNGATASVCLYR